jgi:hypothetical protein
VGAEGEDGHFYILQDASMLASRPKDWAETAIRVYYSWQADRIIAERNYGGDMVEETLRNVDEHVSYKDVNASRGKLVRAEPVLALFQQNKMHLVGTFPELEDELCSYTAAPGQKSPNRLDACLEANTLIETIDGPQKISTIRPGTLVLTRKGYRRVLRSELTGWDRPVIAAQFSNGASLTGTGSHPIWTEERGFIPMDALVCYDTSLSCQNSISKKQQQAEKPSILKGFRTIAIQTVRDVISACISLAARMAELLCSIKPFGYIIADQFRRVITSITKTTIHCTTNSPISNASALGITVPNFAANAVNGEEIIWNAFGLWPRRGMAVSRELNGISGMGQRPGKIGKLFWPESASPAANQSKHSLPEKNSVTGNVQDGQWTRFISTKYKRNVLFAENYFGKANTHGTNEMLPELVPTHVLRLSDAGTCDVYNLEVEDAHEYFANGILVHNCVWAGIELSGAGALGLIELFTSGKAAEMVAMPIGKTMGAASLAAVATNDQTPKCEECGWKVLTTIAGGTQTQPCVRCQNCGHQQWPGGRPQFQQGSPRSSKPQPLGGRMITFEK